MSSRDTQGHIAWGSLCPITAKLHLMGLPEVVSSLASEACKPVGEIGQGGPAPSQPPGPKHHCPYMGPGVQVTFMSKWRMP